ncbi:MAG: aminoacyltransferase, partial [Oscillospiraceae bacterium]|nr:aminoacyltransferase [Oscillospiraceae bacterium]
KPSLFPPYFYSPRGFVVDFFDPRLLERFTDAVRSYCDKQGAMFLKIDPDVELREIDENGMPVPGGFDNGELIDRLAKLGFSHLGFNKGFQGRQPRYTFRIDLLPDKEELLRRIGGSLMKNVRKSEANYEAEVYSGDDTETLYRLITRTSERGGFYAYSQSFYKHFYETLKKYDMATLYLGKAYPLRTAEGLKRQLRDLLLRRSGYKKEQRLLESKQTEARLIKEIEVFGDYAKKYGEEAMICAHLVVNYGKHAWAVHAGSSDDMRETFLNNRVYLHKILDQKDKGMVWFDQFGTVGDPGQGKYGDLHAFKKQFGGRYIEFVGEFDMVFKRFWYRLYAGILPLYRAALFDARALLRRLKN